MAIAYLGLGSNIKNPVKQIQTCFQHLHECPEFTVLAQSSLYQAEPIGNVMQPDFINAVIKIKTELSPMALMSALLDLEARQLRVRDGTRYGPRTLDVDILLYDNYQCALPKLTIPHPELLHRAFVVIPLLEIEPDLVLPNGRKLTAYRASLLRQQKIEKIKVD